MNYHFIKNYYEKVEYPYPDLFDIKIYYLNENYCNINVKRLDSDEGWGLLLEIRLYDIYDTSKYEIIHIGNSLTNIKNGIFKTNIKLEFDNINHIEIPSLVIPRNISIITNKYEILNNDNEIDFHIVLYMLDKYKIQIIVRRLDEEYGWNNDLICILYDKNIKNRKEIIKIGKSDLNYKYTICETKLELFKDDDYTQEIPKIIIQTGYNNKFKNILHFNSIMSFIELNPEYTYIYFSDRESRRFLRNNFSEDVNMSYDMLVPGAFKADLLRYCVLYQLGGCYFDCKQILRVPIRKFLEPNKNLVLCNDVIESALLNAVIFSTQRNPIIEKSIKDCVYNVINKLGKTALDITGPIFFYKSIKKYINHDNLILQNSRPPNDFADFSNDYYNNTIKLISNNQLILNRFYKKYYVNYLDINHYGKLFDNNELYYKNFQLINGIKIFVYPNRFNDKFIFSIKGKDGEKVLGIKRSDSNEGWHFDLKVLIINTEFNDILLTVGKSENNYKEIVVEI